MEDVTVQLVEKSECTLHMVEVNTLALGSVEFTNFLLNWNAHIKHLKSKLKTSFAIIKRISPYVTSNNHKQIYHTLFESHLTYCIPTWGGAKKTLIDQIFTLQKLAVRYLFGDNEKFYEKFNTAARTRPLDEQWLGHDYYLKEHTKPLFNQKKLLTVHNLYKYMAVNEIGKTITTKKPSVIYESFHLSDRNNNKCWSHIAPFSRLHLEN